MSQQGERDNNQEKKKTRRTRKDEQGRDYTCPCGKSYLSYPALYTHVKTKHQGKTPKQDGNGIIARVEMEEDGQAKDPLDSIKQSIERYFPTDCKENYPGKFTEKDNQQINELKNIWKKWEQTIMSDVSQISATSIDAIFGHFLTEIQQKTKAQGYLYLCEFILSFRKGLNNEKGDENYCMMNNGSNLPFSFNDLILHNRLCASMPSKKSTPLNNTTLACKMLYYFGNWIFNQRYSNYSVKFNSTSQ